MEIIDIYNDERQLSGETVVRGTPLSLGKNRQVVHLCLFNSKGEMLIQQRKSTKKLWPSLWDISAGGNSISGETSKQSVHREVLEELGLDIDFTNNRPYITTYFDYGFDDYYFFTKDIDISELKLQKDEVETVKWASLQEVLRLYERGEFIPYMESFLITLFDLKNQRGVILD